MAKRRELAAAGGRVFGAGGLLGVGGGVADVGADVEEAAPRGGDAGRLLRVGVDGEARGLVARLRGQRHLVDVAVHQRRVAGELLRQVAARGELVEGAVARAVLGVEVGDLRGRDATEVRDGRGLVGRAHARLPGGDADGDEDADDRDDDHQLDERETTLPLIVCSHLFKNLAAREYTCAGGQSSIKRARVLGRPAVVESAAATKFYYR